jgi:phage tail sheath protein FI
VTTFLAAERYCARRRATLIWDPPWAWDSVETALLGVRNAGLASANAMTYFPRLRDAADGDRNTRGIPAGGAVAGLLAASDRTGCWRPLDESNGRLASGLAPVLTVSDRQAALLKRSGINVIEPRRPSCGTFAGNVSLVGSSAVSRLWQRLDRRRLLGHILRSLEQHTRWALGAEWSRQFERQLTDQIRDFLQALFDSGALRGSRAEQAYFVRLRAAIQGDERELVIRVGVALDRANEFQVYDVVHRPEISIARPAPPHEAAQLAS